MDILLIIAAIWLIAASYTDIKKREIPNWISFSLVAIALAVRATESIIAWNITPLTTSILGLAVFFLIANLLYYGKVFAGGDAKLLAALGAVIPSTAFLSNLLVVGGIYGLAYTLVIAVINKNKVINYWKAHKQENPSYILTFLLVFFAIGLVFKIILLYLLAAAALLLYLIHIFVNAVEKSCFVKTISARKLTEGDWLVRDVKVRNKFVRAGFQGLTKKDIKILQKANKKVQIKQGIPFVPVFLIAFLLTIFWDNILLLLV